ncbi:hypothetical protein D5125_10230 [Magnetovirga frankeli]|uniref:hypothetical protein n=1 Tax=Magnetovirga frankeli TaxID=947516 RepID=UPI00129316AE|nr:hypothetical protein D5125_10230 [gamma proteobacterium SS-5]
MSLTKPEPPVMILRLREAGIRGGIWAFIGLLYAVLFVFFVVFSRRWDIPADPFFVAAVLAATIGALIYSSMRLAVLMAGLLFPISIIMFTLGGGELDLLHLLAIMLPAGALMGALYGYLSHGSRIRCADAKTLAGFCVGVLVGLLYMLLSSRLQGVPLAWLVAAMSPLTGVLYVLLVPTFIHLYDDLLPPVGDGALVGGFVAVFISICSFVMASSVDTGMAGNLVPEVELVLEQLPSAMLGGVIGAGLAGVISGLLLTDWQDL